MKHTCHAELCDTAVPEKMFMCRSHWYMVPKELRDEVWFTYVPGQEITKTPTLDYIDTAHRAIYAVWDKERQKSKMKLAIVGTRVLAHPTDKEIIRVKLHALLRKYRPCEVISGGAEGVDTIAENTAKAVGYQEGHGLVIYKPAVKQLNGPGGYKERDRDIADDCTHLVRIACTESKTYGSGWTADYAEKIGKRVKRWTPCK